MKRIPVVCAILCALLPLGSAFCQVACDVDGCVLDANVSSAVKLALDDYKDDMAKVKKFKIFLHESPDNIEVSIIMIRPTDAPVYGEWDGHWSITYLVGKDGRHLLKKIYNR